MAERPLDVLTLPCLCHLNRAAENASGIGETLLRHSQSLRWGQSYSSDKCPRSFLDNYGWLELFGSRGHFVNDALAGGFLLLGPDTSYPDHKHVAEEIYIPLTPDTEWRMGGGGYTRRPAGTVIHHYSNVSHAMRTGREPLLAFYLWRNGPLAERSSFV